MKHIRISLAALLSLGAAAVVSAQQAQVPAPAHAQHGQAGVRPHGPGGRGMHARRALFRGIELSDAEKTSLKAVREKYAAQNKALREQFKPQGQALRDARKRGDTAAVKALIEKNAPQREATKQLMLTERADLRAALSAENQAKFDANVAKVQKHAGKRPGK